MKFKKPHWYEENGTTYWNHKGFLIFPKTIDNETRWLEYAEWRDYWQPSCGEYSRWVHDKWITQIELDAKKYNL